jgi:GLPGLI family protein
VYEEVSNLTSGREVKDYEKVEDTEARSYLENQLKAPTVRTSELFVNKGVSLYRKGKETKKSGNATFESGRSKTIVSTTHQLNSTSAIYINYIDSVIVTQTNIGSKTYLIESSMPKNNADWEITSEQQDILGYKCIKAGKTVGQAGKIGEIEMKPRNFVAWYCPDIPVNAGPELHSGLPGLILKVEVDGGLHVSTAISIEPVDSATEIPIPEEGEKVNYEKLVEIITEYIAEMREKAK